MFLTRATARGISRRFVVQRKNHLVRHEAQTFSMLVSHWGYFDSQLLTQHLSQDDLSLASGLFHHDLRQQTAAMKVQKQQVRFRRHGVTQNQLSRTDRISKTSKLGLLTFDLDDTLFHRRNVLKSANKRMIQAIKDRGCTDAMLSEFLDTTESIRRALPAPITSKELRKLAIHETFLKNTKSQPDLNSLDSFVDECYEVWLSQRHDAAEQYIFSDAVETLQILRTLYPDACFAAITNGAGDPRMMPNTLAPFFDFRVSGEDDEIFPHRKPNSFIYEKSIEKYREVMVDNTATNSDGIIWFHVGDSLAKDVGASAACGANAIWMCSENNEVSAASQLTDKPPHPEYLTAVEAGRSMMAGTINELSELPELISTLLESASSIDK